MCYVAFVHHDSKGKQGTRKGMRRDMLGSGCSMIEKWAEKVVFVQNVRGLTCVFETFDSQTRVNYAKNVKKSKKIEFFVVVFFFFIKFAAC